MNTHDIDLPDLPPCFEVLTDRTHTEIRAYARAAIEADRKRRGEPVAWLYEDELPDNYPYDTMFPYSKVDGVRMFPVYAPQPAEPVKVPSDDVLDAALSNLEHDNYEQSYSGYKNRQADIALIRAILARYSHLTATTYKSSNQNRLIEDFRLVYGDNKPIATVITHNNHKLLSFDPGALDELPEGTVLYAKKYGAK